MARLELCHWMTLLALVTSMLCVVTLQTNPVERSYRQTLIDLLVEEYLGTRGVGQDAYSGDANARAWLEEYNQECARRLDIAGELAFQYLTDITDEHAQQKLENGIINTKWSLKKIAEAKQFTDVEDPDLKRQLNLITTDASSSDPEVSKRMSEITNKLEGIYGTAVVEHDGKTYNLEPDLEDILAHSRDYDELLWVWKGWRDASGKQMRNLYTESVALHNVGAQENGFADKGDYLRKASYEVDDLEEMVDELFERVKPMYMQLHAYARRKLRETYPNAGITKTSPIPAHLFGNMWAQQWNNIMDLLIPYGDVPSTDVTDAMLQQQYTPLTMFKTAEEFFKSIGLEPMTQDFWDKSMIVRPKGREVQCHASASDFSNGKDYRIKMCTNVNQQDLFTIHHEMGHIEYYMQYRHQPTVYRGGANPGFHEAVGDTIALSVATPGHMEKIKLLDDDDADKDADKKLLNFLMSMALQKVAFLPFGLLIDKYRWDIYRGKVNESNYNSAWWQARLKYQGISPPTPRSEEDFDPGAKYHVASGTPYIRYFFSFIMQFSFHKALCKEAGHTGTLQTCDIYQSKDAGNKLKDMLSLGASKPWPDALKVLTDSTKVDPTAILEYFQPLTEWLTEDNRKHGETPGWDIKEQTLKIKIDDGGLYPKAKESQRFNELTELEREILEALKP